MSRTAAPRPRSRRRAVRTARASAVAAAALLLAGCGIRPSTYPVDAGAPAVRTTCKPGDAREPTLHPDASSSPSPTIRPVYLICGSAVTPVDREVPETSAWQKNRRYAADTLLALLGPGKQQQGAPYSTSVPDGLRTTRTEHGDPDGALRLTRAPGLLSDWAVAQVVCTFAANLGDRPSIRRPVALGGPDGPVTHYTCEGRRQLIDTH